MNDRTPGYAGQHHRHHGLEREDKRLQGGLREAGAQTNQLRRETEHLQHQLDWFKDHVAANLASLNELAAELTIQVSGDPGFAAMTTGVLRALTFNLGYEFMGEAVPADWDPDAEYCRLAGLTEADRPASSQEPDEPEPQEYDPGPEVDDMGGMSEHPRLIEHEEG